MSGRRGSKGNVELVPPEREFPVTEAQRAKARWAIAGRAIDASDAAELMLMLGVHPCQQPDPHVTSYPD
jgi:hypothetical protein